MGEAAKKIQPSKKLSLKDLLETLVSNSYIGRDFAKEIYTQYKHEDRNPLLLLSQFGIRDKRNPELNLNALRLTEWYATTIGVPFVNIEEVEIKVKDVIAHIPKSFCEEHNIIPILADENKVLVAMSDPFQMEWVKEITEMVPQKVSVKMASPSQIEHYIDEIFSNYQNLASLPKRNKSAFADPRLEDFQKLLTKAHKAQNQEKDNSVEKLCDWLINYAYAERASDIHLEPKRNNALIRFRIDGKLVIIHQIENSMMLNIVSRLKIIGAMKLDERRKPQDGRIKRFLENGRKVELRLSTVPTATGEKLVIRIFDNQVAQKNLDFIGFTQKDKKAWDDLIHQPQGLILVTGPTGSGKTTTLYTSLNIVAKPEMNVCTVEDPIEMLLDSLNQVQVNNQIGLDFAKASRAFLRQDPDIIMVGEIRDRETAEVAIQASLTGHLVFSTLHTNGALATIQRLIDIGLPSFLINSSLKAILAQRLLRKLCPHCKVKIKTDKAAWSTLTKNEKIDTPEYVYEAKGCDSCKNLGYVGRTCVYELIEYNDEIKKVIHQKIDISELQEKTKGMFKPIRESCAEKVAEGITSIQEAMSVAY